MPARWKTRRILALTAIAALALPASSVEATGCVAPLTDRCESWASAYDGPAGQNDSAEAVAVSPAGDRVFVGGIRTVGWSAPFSGTAQDTDYGIVAYETGTGRELWTAGYAGPGDPESGSRDDFLLDLEVNGDGSIVFATGYSRDGRGPVDYDWATVAVDAATGRRLWATRHNTGGDAWDVTWDLAVGSVPDEEGTERELVFVAGHMGSTVAYDAASGTKVWEASLTPGPDFRSVAFSPANGEDAPLVHAAGNGVVITYDARSGQEVWRSLFGEKETPFYAWAVVASEESVFVSGWGATVFDLNEGIELEGVTAAYDARSGERFWQTISGAPDVDDFFWDVASSPSGDRVYATGDSTGTGSTAVTAAYDAATGAQVWVSRYAGLTGASAVSDSLTVHPDGGEVYIAAASVADPFTTVAYDALTGKTRWEARYTSPGLGYSYRLAPSPDGSRLFVTGAHGNDFLTVAYDL